MAFATLNGLDVLAATIRMERLGAWTAEVSVDAQSAPSGRVELVADSARFSGSVIRAGVARDVLTVRIVGGAGGLARDVNAQRYARGTPVRVVVTDILSAAGEALSPTAEAGMLSRTLDGWTRQRGRAADALRVLTQAIGASWRVLADGTVWVGAETWGEVDPEHVLVDEDPKSGRIEIADEALRLRPGVSFQCHRIARVEHRLSGSELRSVAWTDAAGDDAAAALEGIVRHLTAGSLFLGMFPARVVAQNGDGSLEIQPDDSRLPGMSRVPIRYGIPGVSVEVAPGARVGIEFETGDPGRPVATVWESGSVVRMSITAVGAITVEAQTVNVGAATQVVQLSGGGLGVARMGDPVQAGPFAGAVAKGSLLVSAGG